MTPQEKAQQLTKEFGKEFALKVVGHLLQRDKQWIEKLSEESPDKWQLSDFDKSIKMYEEVKTEIQNISTDSFPDLEYIKWYLGLSR